MYFVRKYLKKMNFLFLFYAEVDQTNDVADWRCTSSDVYFDVTYTSLLLIL